MAKHMKHIWLIVAASDNFRDSFQKVQHMSAMTFLPLAVLQVDHDHTRCRPEHRVCQPLCRVVPLCRCSCSRQSQPANHLLGFRRTHCPLRNPHEEIETVEAGIAESPRGDCFPGGVPLSISRSQPQGLLLVGFLKRQSVPGKSKDCRCWWQGH